MNKNKEEIKTMIKMYEDILRETKSEVLNGTTDTNKAVVLMEIYRTLHELNKELNNAA